MNRCGLVEQKTGYDSDFPIKYFGLHMRRAYSNHTQNSMFAWRQLKRT